VPYYRRSGQIPRKRHARFEKPGGGLHTEELVGADGFSAESALLYHLHPPTATLAAEAVAVDPPCLHDNHPLLPRHYRTHGFEPGGDLVRDRRLLLANADVRISYAAADRPSELFRDATADTLIYVEDGAAVVESVFGHLPLGPGDYAVIPRSTTHRFAVTAGVRALLLETTGHVGLPARYLSPAGQLLEHAPFSERDLRAPDPADPIHDGEASVLVHHRGGWTRYTYRHHPFDVVGWDGCLYPYALSIHDFEPIVKRFHAPPPVHQTFAGAGFVVCSFCPRPFDFDPDAVPVPYHHANVDSDEVLFYSGGDFMSRRGAGISQGSVSLHPAGWTHGPQPGSVEAALGRTRTEELAVMVDTFRPLQLTAAADRVEDPEYAWTWARG
jgi:homogentisate 1,2-dioxygenase